MHTHHLPRSQSLTRLLAHRIEDADAFLRLCITLSVSTEGSLQRSNLYTPRHLELSHQTSSVVLHSAVSDDTTKVRVQALTSTAGVVQATFSFSRALM